MGEDNALAQKLLDERVRGRNWLEIEQKHGIPAAEARQIVNEVLQEVATKDPIEMRYLIQLRLEKITDHLWDGLERGEFKSGEAIVKVVERLAELMDLNQDTIKHQITIISDEETLKLFNVLKEYGNRIYDRISHLPTLGEQTRAALEESWHELTAEAATESVEHVIYAEVVE
jgi:hypothetical protein